MQQRQYCTIVDGVGQVLCIIQCGPATCSRRKSWGERGLSGARAQQTRKGRRRRFSPTPSQANPQPWVATSGTQCDNRGRLLSIASDNGFTGDFPISDPARSLSHVAQCLTGGGGGGKDANTHDAHDHPPDTDRDPADRSDKITCRTHPQFRILVARGAGGQKKAILRVPWSCPVTCHAGQPGDYGGSSQLAWSSFETAGRMRWVENSVGRDR